MLQPSKEKYRKKFRGKVRGTAFRGNEVSEGDFGLQAVTGGWVEARQIEAARKAIAQSTKRKGKLWIRIFPDKSYSAKPAEVRMGSGKGDIAGYVAVVKPGRIIFELGGVEEEVAKEALRLAGHKLAVRTKFVTK